MLLDNKAREVIVQVELRKSLYRQRFVICTGEERERVTIGD